jgi:serine phosphatase RsbU (regulator of sigma subunit)
MLLHQAVHHERILEPNKILTRLNKNIWEALQDEHKHHHTIDIAICVIDKEQESMEYSGARNTMLVIRNGEMMPLEGSRKKVGGPQHESEKIFAKQHLTIDPSDVFYIFSNGYIDQLDTSRHKFTKDRFFKLLHKNYFKPMKEQKQIFDDTFKEWSQNMFQIDDVLVIGFKI